jgi:hypothetical protein
MVKRLIKLAEEFEAQTQYLENISPSLRSLQSAFPNVKLRPFGEFKTFLDRYITTLIRKYLVGTQSVKNCSGISPDFAEFAAKYGFAVLIENVPGHVRNIFLAEDSAYIVDLSFIQFTCGYRGYEDEDILIETLKDIYHNPYKAVSIQKLPTTYFGNFHTPHGKYDNLYNPVKYIELYDKDNERQEEDYQTLENWDKVLRKKKKDEEISNTNSNVERQGKTSGAL